MPFGISDENWGYLQRGQTIPGVGSQPVNQPAGGPNFTLESINGAQSGGVPASAAPARPIFGNGTQPTIQPPRPMDIPTSHSNPGGGYGMQPGIQMNQGVGLKGGSLTPANTGVMPMAKPGVTPSGPMTTTPPASFGPVQYNPGASLGGAPYVPPVTPPLSSPLGGNTGTGTGMVDPNATPYTGPAATPIGSTPLPVNAGGPVRTSGNTTYDPYGLSGSGAGTNLTNMSKVGMGGQPFRGGVSAAAPSNNRPLNQGSPTSAGAGNRPVFNSASLANAMRNRTRIPNPDYNNPEAAPGSDTHAQFLDTPDVTIPGIGAGRATILNGQHIFVPENQQGRPNDRYQIYYAPDAQGNYTRRIRQQDFSHGFNPLLNAAVMTALTAGVGGIAGMAGISAGGALNAAGNAVGIPAGTLNTVGQGLRYARYGRTAYNLANMGKIGRA